MIDKYVSTFGKGHLKIKFQVFEICHDLTQLCLVQYWKKLVPKGLKNRQPTRIKSNIRQTKTEHTVKQFQQDYYFGQNVSTPN